MMIGKLFKSLLVLSLVLALGFSVSGNVYAKQSLLGTSGLFTDAENIHEDEDLLSELDNIGSRFNSQKVTNGIDLYRWLYDLRYLNSKYSNSVSNESISYEVNRALSNIPFEGKDSQGKTTYTGEDYYHSIRTVLTSLQKEIKGENPYASLREKKDQEILKKLKNGSSLDSLIENDKMSNADETYFSTYYQQAVEYKNGRDQKDYKDWVNSARKLNKNYPKSSIYGDFDSLLDTVYKNGLDGYYNRIFGMLNSLWDQTHYDFAHITSNKLDSLMITQMPSKTTYDEGNTFRTSGLAVQGTYKQVWSDGRTPTTYDVSNMKYTADTTTKLTYFDASGNRITSWPVTVNDGTTSLTINVPITINPIVKSSSLTSLKIASNPKKTVYKEGETFNKEGLAITGVFTDTYSDNSVVTREKANMSFSYDSHSLSANETYVTVSVKSGSDTQTINVPITVNRYVKSASLDSIYFASRPNKVKYTAGEAISTDGMKVNAVIKKTMSDNSVVYETKENVPVTVTYPYAIAQVGSNTITVTYNYSEDGFTGSKSLTQQIEVTKQESTTSTLTNVEKQVVPGKVKITSVKAGKKKITVKWKKSKNAVKYKVYYRLKVKSKKKQKKIKWKSKTVKLRKYTIKKLKSKKTYQVRVRAYNGKAHGAYSATKTVKVK